MLNSSTKINKANNHLSIQITEYIYKYILSNLAEVANSKFVFY
jgi:hypothetical protein